MDEVLESKLSPKGTGIGNRNQNKNSITSSEVSVLCMAAVISILLPPSSALVERSVVCVFHYEFLDGGGELKFSWRVELHFLQNNIANVVLHCISPLAILFCKYSCKYLIIKITFLMESTLGKGHELARRGEVDRRVKADWNLSRKRHPQF
jgi:hypothetical protein